MSDSSKNNSLPSKNNQEIEIDLVDLFHQLLFHWKLILLCMVICGSVVFLYCKFYVTPQYSSTSGLYVFSKSTSVTSLADLQIGSNLTTDYETVITGRPVLDRVITRLKLDMNYAQLRSKISLTNPSDSRILYITATDPDPEMAKAIADRVATIAATFISQKMDQDPPSIIQTGYTDGAPVSPTTGKNTLIGVLVGLLIACAYVVITYLLNDTVLTPEDVQEKLGLDVLASLPLEENMIEDRHKKKKVRSLIKRKTGSRSSSGKKSA